LAKSCILASDVSVGSCVGTYAAMMAYFRGISGRDCGKWKWI
jgi:hypothetical protein